MSKHKTEVILKGEFTTIDVYLEGIEIPLREINDSDYYKLYSAFEITDPLNISARLKGFTSMDWELIIKVDSKSIYSKKGTFDAKGFTTFSATKKI